VFCTRSAPPKLTRPSGIIFELLWRDFFQYTTLKYSLIPAPSSRSPLADKANPNSTLFNPTGYSASMSLYPDDQRPDPSEWHTPNLADKNDPARRWCEGRTGVPFIDANMRELIETGWMSNRGRQNVASFLVKDL
jgi:deoxyribodipyrimidine photo-lyase